MNRDSLQLISIDQKAIQTLLIGGFLLTIGSIFITPLIIGYLIRILSDSETNHEHLIPFERWKELFVDGVMGFVIWVVYSTPALFVLIYFGEVYFVASEEWTGTSEGLIVDYFTALVDYWGIVIGGMGGISRGVLRIAQDIAVLMDMVPPANLFGDPSKIIFLVNVLYVGILLGTFYLIPAALANYADHQTFRSGFSLREIWSVTRRYSYLKSWILALGLWTFGGLSFIVWNSWRSDIPVPDWTTHSIGIIPVVSIPTQIGMISTTSLLLAGIVSFYLLAYSYRTIGTTWHKLRANENIADKEKKGMR